ncbi:MAG: hypothetical protein HXY20_14200 [Acidobacteria bacterium]|nr:hypothetical protein [Acidobacteriota bacterium]
MPIPMELLALGQDAYYAAQANDRVKALERLDGFAQILSVQDQTSDFEFASMMALIGRVYAMLNEPRMAALSLADVCAFAELHFPDTTETAGDYYELSEALESSGDIEGAIRAMDRSAHHLSRHPEWVKCEAAYCRRRNALHARLNEQATKQPS